METKKRDFCKWVFFDVLLKNLLVLHAISFCFRAYRIVRETVAPSDGRKGTLTDEKL